MAAPIRTCAGCGRKSPRIGLVRFSVLNGELKRTPGAKGRGVYTCPHVHCFERALASHSFSRVLRTAVRVDPALRDIYTDANG